MVGRSECTQESIPNIEGTKIVEQVHGVRSGSPISQWLLASSETFSTEPRW